MQKTLFAALKRYPVFSVKDIANVLDKAAGYAYLVAFRLKKSGVINEVEKGKYSFEEDPFIIASWIVWPSYITGWAALNYYKLTEQLAFTIHVATTRKRKKKSIVFGKTRIEFIKIKKSLFFGFERIIFHGMEIFIAEKEKAIVDAVGAKKMSLAEVAQIVKENKRKISVKKLFSYAKNVRGLNKKLRSLLRD